MNNIEERFLGYFRLLESLCYQTKCHLDPDALNALIKRVKPFVRRYFNNSKGVSSFLSGIPRFNRSKYNTEKCISDFYRTLSTTITNEWNLNSEDIKDICTLRNDITHANDFYINEQELTRKTVFIETLLIFSLGEKIGIDTEIMGAVIHRLNGYHILINSDINYTKALSN
ncbi:HEPN domain-containing protein [Aeromonas hydrophila]|uniref:HEPN domain-containing protein n=1 Tax=Aeromonas hydrophila TaxID=644 RepID=UPI003006F697